MRLIDADELSKLIDFKKYKSRIQWTAVARGKKSKGYLESCAYREAVFDTLGDVLAYIRERPTIDAEPVRRGEWCGEWEHGRYMCSVCKAMTDVAEIMGKPAYKFCPHCGAVMDGGADNAVSG